MFHVKQGVLVVLGNSKGGLGAKRAQQAEAAQISSGVLIAMFRSYRSKLTKTRLIGLASICAFVACAIGIGWGLLESSKYQREADNHARQYAEYTRDYVGQSCVAMSPLRKADCLDDARDKRRAYERNEQDLVAQRQSALWAYIMAAAAVIGVGLSAVGVWLVYATFRETKGATTVANETLAHTQETDRQLLRPWVSAKIIPREVVANGNGVKVRFDVVCQNHGDTVARNFKVFYKLRYTGLGVIDHLTGSSNPAAADGESNGALMPGDMHIIPVNLSINPPHDPWIQAAEQIPRIEPYVELVATYRAAQDTGDEFRRTERGFTIAPIKHDFDHTNPAPKVFTWDAHNLIAVPRPGDIAT
jgi:hypothetical protein